MFGKLTYLIMPYNGKWSMSPNMFQTSSNTVNNTYFVNTGVNAERDCLLRWAN